MAAALRSEMPDGHARAAAPRNEGAEKARSADALGDARDQMRQASRELDNARDPARAAPAAAGARQAMLQAARDLQAAAQLAAAALAPSFPGLDEAGDAGDGEAQASDERPPGGQSSPDPKSAPGGKAEADLTELKELVRQKTGRSWGELPGHLRNEILQMQAGRYRDEYARVIQLYFREIAAGAVADEKPKR